MAFHHAGCNSYAEVHVARVTCSKRENWKQQGVRDDNLRTVETKAAAMDLPTFLRGGDRSHNSHPNTFLNSAFYLFYNFPALAVVGRCIALQPFVPPTQPTFFHRYIYLLFFFVFTLPSTRSRVPVNLKYMVKRGK